MGEKQNDVSINITTSTIVRTILFLALAYTLYLLRDIVLVVLTAVVVASAVEPAARWFARYKIPRVPAVILVYACVTLVFAGIFYFFAPPLLNEASSFTSALPQYIETTASAEGGGIVSRLPEIISLKELVSQAKDIFSGASGGAFEAISVVFGGIFSFIIIVVISFYLAVQEDGIANFLKLISPVQHQDYVVDLWRRSQMKIGRWFQGQLLLGLLIGVLVFLGLSLLQVPYALLLAIVAAVFEIIPIFGPVLAALPAIALAFTDVSATIGFATIALYIIIQQFENHLIYPLVVQKVVGVSPILVILALIIGAKLAGFLGVILSVPVAAALFEFAQDVAKEKHIG